MKRYPLPINSGQEAKLLEYVGKINIHVHVYIYMKYLHVHVYIYMKYLHVHVYTCLFLLCLFNRR